jgi:hypothetical protein
MVLSDGVIYRVLAVIYNDGQHYWADLCVGGHTYHYDGMRDGGRMRHLAPHFTCSSDTRYLTLVLYRRLDHAASYH